MRRANTAKDKPETTMTRFFIAGIAALFLATETAHASVHRSFHRCGKYLATNAWSFDYGDKWSLLFQQDGRARYVHGCTGHWRAQSLGRRHGGPAHAPRR